MGLERIHVYKIHDGFMLNELLCELGNELMNVVYPIVCNNTLYIAAKEVGGADVIVKEDLDRKGFPYEEVEITCGNCVCITCNTDYNFCKNSCQQCIAGKLLGGMGMKPLTKCEAPLPKQVPASKDTLVIYEDKGYCISELPELLNSYKEKTGNDSMNVTLFSFGKSIPKYQSNVKGILSQNDNDGYTWITFASDTASDKETLLIYDKKQGLSGQTEMSRLGKKV